MRLTLLSRGVLLAASVALPACDRARGEPDASPNASSSPSATSSQVPASASAAALPPLVGEGCHAGVDLSGDALAALGRIAKACMPGSIAVSEPASATLGQGVRVHLDSNGTCVRVAALAGPELGNLELVLADSTGKEIARDTLPGRVALIAEGGPVCVRKSGDYEVTARATKAAGSVALGVWRAE